MIIVSGKQVGSCNSKSMKKNNKVPNKDNTGGLQKGHHRILEETIICLVIELKFWHQKIFLKCLWIRFLYAIWSTNIFTVFSLPPNILLNHAVQGRCSGDLTIFLTVSKMTSFLISKTETNSIVKSMKMYR